MPKNTEKQARNKIREQYARQYATKIKEKDGTIRHLAEELAETKKSCQALEASAQEKDGIIKEKDALIQELQNAVGLSSEELQAMKADLAAKAATREAVDRISGMTEAMFRGIGTRLMGAGAYGLLAGGALGMPSRDSGPYVYKFTEQDVDGCGTPASEYAQFQEPLDNEDLTVLAGCLKDASDNWDGDSDTSDMIGDALARFSLASGKDGQITGAPYLDELKF